MTTYYAFQPACPTNTSANGPFVDCAGATSGCPVPGQMRFLIYAGTDPTSLPLVPGATVCLGAGDIATSASSVDQIGQQVDRFVHVAAGTIGIAPPGGVTLVGLPTVFWVTGVAPHSVAVAIDGASVQITVTPSLTWVFGDGTSTTTTWVGRPYSPAVDPQADPGYYLLHTYRAAGPMQVSLLVTWSPTYEIKGVAGQFTADPVVRQTGALLMVAPATAVLTGNS